MRKNTTSKESAFLNPRTFVAFVLCTAAIALGAISLAGTPSSGTLNPSATTTLTYTGGPYANDNPTDPVGMTPPVCNGTVAPCDQFALAVTIPSGNTKSYQVNVNIGWTNATATTSDFDVYVYQPDITGTMVASSASSSDPENTSFTVPAGSGTTNYTVIVVPYATDHLTTFTGTLKLTEVGTVAPPAPPTGPTPAPGVALFDNFTPTNGLGGDWGEPSIGIDLQSEKNGNGGTIMSYGGFSAYALRVTYNDCTSPARALFESTALVTTALPRALGDPILFTVHNPAGTPDRTLVSQLNGSNVPNIDFTDNDGASYLPSQGSGIASGFDHQTIGAGPYPAGVTNPGLYPNAVYYCSQEDAFANCARSDTGGSTFGPAVPIYNASQCVGLHGHVKVAPDGTVYVPNRGCGGNGLLGATSQAVVVSTDAGITWTIRPVPGSKPGSNDPSIAVGQNSTGKPAGNLNGTNTIYFGWADSDKHPLVAVSHDRGLNWTTGVDVGVPFSIQNVAFPSVTAGDDNRAAFSFLGTNAPGGGTSQDTSFQGTWHLFVVSTYDGGATWNTVDATPTDPVQRGVICLAGTLCATGTRNLLDFIDSTVDKEGRVNIVYADGCVNGCVNGTTNSGTSISTFARQSAGKTLFAAYDSVFNPAGPVAPKQPLATAALLNGSTVKLSWVAPTNTGGAAITGYKIYRGSDSTATINIATLGPDVFTFTDPMGSATSFYYVTAINSAGESAQCDKVFPTTTAVALNPCTLPGVTVVSDPAGDQTGAPLNSDLDITSVSVAEPFVGAGVNQLVFTMKVADLSSIPANHQWRILWTPSTPPSATDDRYYVGMRSTAPGTVSYEYGTVSSNGNVPTMVGTPDAGSFSPDGTIRITIANSKVGNPSAGSTLATLSGRNFAGSGLATLTKTSATDSTADSSYTLVGNASCQSLQLGSVSSRKTHGAAGVFDIDLTGGNGVECRTGGAGGNYTMVFKFANPIASVSGASAASAGGSPAVTSSAPGTDPNEYLVNLSGVPNAQRTTVTLTGLTDSAGNSAASVTGTMAVLAGDTSGDKTVNSADISQTKAQSGQIVSGSNFREDVTADGAINSADISLVKSKSGTALPASP